jgi:hypothetical protein
MNAVLFLCIITRGCLMLGTLLIYRCRLLPLCMILSAALAACETGPLSRGPFSPEARARAAAGDQYQALLTANMVSDETFKFETLSSAIILRVLRFSPAVEAAAAGRFSGDPIFSRETRGWSSVNGTAGPGVVVLMGLFAPDLAENDVVVGGRFRPRLQTPDGRVLAPAEIKRYGRDKNIIRDYFPVFNPWEEVYLVRFAPPAGTSFYGDLKFRLLWPGGAQTLTLPGSGSL